jgi:hypothetical protein
VSPAALIAGPEFLLTPGAFVSAIRGQDLPLRQAAREHAALRHYYVVQPDVGANRQIRAQMQLMFPK